MNYSALRQELTTDPLNWAYAPMTDAQAAAKLNALDTGRTVPRTDVKPTEVYGAMTYANWPDRTSKPKDADIIQATLSMPVIDMSDPSVRALVLNVVPNPSPSRTALIALATRSVSRAAELGLGTVTEGDVALARGGVWLRAEA